MTAVWPRLQIDATAATVDGSTFIIDHSAIDGSDTLGTAPAYVYVPDADLRRVSIRRGGRRWRYDAGEAVIVLDNRSGDYDPDNAGGTYSTLGRSLIVPGMLAKVSIRTYDYYEATAFTGRLTDVRVDHDPVAPTVTWIFEDALAELGRVDVSDAGGAQDTSNQIASDLLDEAHAPSSAVTAGGLTVQRPATGSVRDALQRIADSNAGRFFVATDGAVTCEWRSDEASKSVEMTINSDQVSPYAAAITADPGFATVLNEVALRMADGTEVRAGAADRVSTYDAATLTLDTLLVDFSDAEDLAAFLASYQARPGRVVSQLVAKPQAWSSYDSAVATTLDIGSRVAVNMPGGQTFDGTVERIDWDFDADVTLRLGFDRYDPAGFGNADWFVIDTSSIDGTAVLAY